MCTGLELFAAASAGGSLFSGAAGMSSHNLSAKLAGGNADLLRTQAAIAEGNADLAVVRGNYDEFLSRRKVNSVLAAETAHFASGNVDPTYGSPAMIQAFTAAQGEVDAQLIRARTASARADALTGAANIAGQAAQQQFKAASEKGAAITSLVSGVLKAGTDLLYAGSKWPGLQETGATGRNTSSAGQFDGNNPWGLY
jgi:hypothetical protein